ncbi:MAG: sugar ABC transporter substrate-binding protein [Oscillospiraceae bacterium]|jgi:ribose transport system substrate-binding protein|nr:sugar ABC transporter substrate-binding protein [Oscillospiraceae bacterium]
MKRIKVLLALVLALAMVGGGTLALAEELKDFTIDPAKIPQEKLDTVVSLAVSVRGLENPYIATIKVGMEMFAVYLDSIGQKYEMQVLDSGGDSNKEVDNMRQFAANAGGNALAYSDPNENAIAYSLAEAMAEAGGFIGTAWNKPADVGPADLTPNWVIHTSPDNVINGYNTAKALFDYMGGKGKIFVCEGMLGNTAAIDRAKGLDQALAEYPDITVAGRDTGNWATAEALTLVETWLGKDPDVGGVWCANDNMATGALQALEKAGLKGKVGVTGVDANTDIVEAVRDGFAVATVSSNGYLQGGYTLAICYAAWAGLIDVTTLPPEYREFATPALLITKENAAEYLSSVPEFDFSKPFACKAD